MLKLEECFDYPDSKAFVFESFGVKIEIRSNKPEHLTEIYKRLVHALPQNLEIIEKRNSQHRFFVESGEDEFLKLWKNDEEITGGDSKVNFFNFFESKLRLTVAEFAEKHVFLHSGVVAHKGKAILVPASSFRGKTTLVKELVRAGAVYYSDEYAVLDERGFVSPFPKTLSVRDPRKGGYEQIEQSAESFGGVTGDMPIPVGMVLVTEFVENGEWKPSLLSPGKGVMEMLQHAIPVRQNPEYVLKVLNLVASRAIICESSRGEAKEFAKLILDFFVLNT